MGQAAHKRSIQPVNLLKEWMIPALYFVGMYLFYPFRNVFLMDFDEGFNLVKAQLLLRGFALYRDVWSDQPPLFTYLLAGILRFIGQNVNIVRGFTLILVCIFIWAFWKILASVWGKWHAAAGILLLFLLPRFTDLSVSVMIGLPAIVFAALSMGALMSWHRQSRYFWLVVSAVLMATSVLIKLFTGFLAPIFVVGILIDGYSKDRDLNHWFKWLRPAFIWGIIFSALFLIPIWTTVTPQNLGQLINDHLTATALANYENDPRYWLWPQLIDARPILILTVFGGFYTILRKRWLFLYPLAWTVAAFIFLSNHLPVWTHQQLLVTIPAVFLSAVAGGEALSTLWGFLRARPGLDWQMLVGLACALLFGFALAVRFPPVLSAFNDKPTFKSPGFKQTSTEMQFLYQVIRFAPQTHWMVTDLPIYAFYARVPIPPNLAVFSMKRLTTGQLTEESIIETMQVYQPEQVLLGRQGVDLPLVRQYVKENYELFFSKHETELYVLDRILGSNKP
jgi:4-amino-4-deoxy-L-arabinose transferase-like glycosyltransferase